MTAKPTPPPRRGGPTQPEHLRDKEQVKLRMLPHEAGTLRALAKRWDLDLGETVVEMMSRLGCDTDEGPDE